VTTQVVGKARRHQFVLGEHPHPPRQQRLDAVPDQRVVRAPQQQRVTPP
jgi:hypothetical protein